MYVDFIESDVEEELSFLPSYRSSKTIVRCDDGLRPELPPPKSPSSLADMLVPPKSKSSKRRKKSLIQTTFNVQKKLKTIDSPPKCDKDGATSLFTAMPMADYKQGHVEQELVQYMRPNDAKQPPPAFLQSCNLSPCLTTSQNDFLPGLGVYDPPIQLWDTGEAQEDEFNSFIPGSTFPPNLAVMSSSMNFDAPNVFDMKPATKNDVWKKWNRKSQLSLPSNKGY
jgi:hypothetical protein